MSFSSPPCSISSFSGGNYEELFHSEFSDYTETAPIIDSIVPNCPTNISALINTKRREILFTWYYPISNSTDGSIQNDIKYFEILRFTNSKELVSIDSSTIPRYLFSVDDSLLDESMDIGLIFCVRAVDYHDLVSPISKMVLIKLNKDYGCKKSEINPRYVTMECGQTEDKTIILSKKMFFDKDSITFSPGSYVGIKEPFKNNTNMFLVTINDMNTGASFSMNLSITHTHVLNLKQVLPTFSFVRR